MTPGEVRSEVAKSVAFGSAETAALFIPGTEDGYVVSAVSHGGNT